MLLSTRRIATVAFRFRATSKFSTSCSLRSTDNPIPANDPRQKPANSPVSATNELPVSSEGAHDGTFVESQEDGERRRVMQAPNRATVWSRSQQPREKAMVGPRFEQTIMELQPRPMAAIDLIHKQPVRWIKGRSVSCDGGGGPLGHPRIFVNVDKPQICWCTYCGVPYAAEKHKKFLESQPTHTYPLYPTEDPAQVPESQSNTGRPLEQR